MSALFMIEIFSAAGNMPRSDRAYGVRQRPMTSPFTVPMTEMMTKTKNTLPPRGPRIFSIAAATCAEPISMTLSGPRMPEMPQK